MNLEMVMEEIEEWDADDEGDTPLQDSERCPHERVTSRSVASHFAESHFPTIVGESAPRGAGDFGREEREEK